ncbi:hypothetical protein [Virgibacillus salexigens]|uniref:Cation/H+ exchanger domain-containing protein n=1 Tax=Virgibacillus kapii TaxID=1638645 RepID=A0ABQ2DJB7_9BACI|nr:MULTISPECIES: hypothetical protein [Virgibacillus]GGJ59538.1 hypothetical protein GCM10007111_21890 [Virgibacillus kapii]
MLPELFHSNLFILAVSIILIISILGVQFSARINSPSLVFFIIIGMILGSDTIDVFDFRDPEIAQLIGMMALVIILFVLALFLCLLIYNTVNCISILFSLLY